MQLGCGGLPKEEVQEDIMALHTRWVGVCCVVCEGQPSLMHLFLHGDIHFYVLAKISPVLWKSLASTSIAGI